MAAGQATNKSKKGTRKTTKKPEKSFEETLWDSANKLRGTVESSEYKHVVLSLIFLKFSSDKFEARRQELIDEGKENYLDMVDFYTAKNVFYLWIPFTLISRYKNTILVSRVHRCSGVFYTSILSAIHA